MLRSERELILVEFGLDIRTVSTPSTVTINSSACAYRAQRVLDLMTMAQSRKLEKDVDALPDTGAHIPQPIRLGGYFGLVEGSIGLIVAGVLINRDFMGYESPGAVISGFGTALWFILIFGAIFASGIALLKGKMWGRGPIVIFQLCLLGVAYYMFTSGRPELGLPTVAVALLGLGLMFHRNSVEWVASRYGK